jgi:hypothetical protein
VIAFQTWQVSDRKTMIGNATKKPHPLLINQEKLATKTGHIAKSLKSYSDRSTCDSQVFLGCHQ